MQTTKKQRPKKRPQDLRRPSNREFQRVAKIIRLNVRTLRHRLGFTLAQFADPVGMTPQFLNALENCKNGEKRCYFNLEQLTAISAAYYKPIEKFFKPEAFGPYVE